MNNETRAAPDNSAQTIAEFPLSATQLRCWFLDQMQPGNPALNVAVRWELRGTVQTTNLERAFQTVIDRHEILRTRLVAREGTPVQQVVTAVRFKLDTVDIRTIPTGEQGARVDRIAHEVAARPFDLGQPGLIRATLIRLASDRAMLVYVVHQSCFDGFSIRVLGHEIGTAAQAFEEGRAPDLPELALQYGDFALWQEACFASGALEDEAAYWTGTLADAPYFEVEPDRARLPVKTTDVAQVNLDLASDFGDRLKRRAQALGVSTFTLGAAVWAACLHRLTGARDILFGTQIAGRLETELDPLIGVFINNLVLRFAADPAAPLADHVAAAKPVVEGALTHQAMPFNMLVERMNPVRDPARAPLISINFNLQQVFMESRTYGGFELVSSPSHAPGAIYDLDLAVMGRPTGWQLNLEFSEALFDRATAQAMLDLVRAAFDLALDRPDAPVSDIPLPEALATRCDADRGRVMAAEQALTAHPMISEAAVIRTAAGLYGFVVPGETGTTPLELLPTRIRDSLAGDPALADLSGISLLGDFPRASTGEINRALLKVPQTAGHAARQAAAPAEVTKALKRDWQEVLGLDSIGTTAHFFDLGGHSVLVLRLLTRIRDRWGVQLDVTQVYEHPTLPELARLVSSRLDAVPGEADGDWRIMNLRQDGAGQPLVAVNNAATALALSTAGDTPRATTCVRVYDGDRGIALDDRPFESIAAEYAKVIRKAQPDGPYLFYGNCVHGNLALEAARILHQDGAEIAGVVMKDVWEPAYTAKLLSDPAARRAEKLHTLKSRLRAVGAGEMSVAAFLGMYRLTRKSGLLQLGTALGLFDRARISDLEEDQERFVSHVSRLRDAYRPAPVAFPVLHVVTDITPQGRHFKPSIGWEDVVAPGLLVTVHPGKVMVLRNRRIGVEKMAREIDRFLATRHTTT